MTEIQENIENKKKIKNRSIGWVFVGIYALLTIGLKIGLTDMKDSAFYGMLSFGVVGIIALLFVNLDDKEKIDSRLDAPINTDLERIAKEKIDIKDVKIYAKKIAIAEGFSIIRFGSHMTKTYGEGIKRRVAILPIIDEFSWGEWTWMQSLSEPNQYSLIKSKLDGRNIDKYAESLAYARTKPDKIIREVRTFTDPQTGEPRQIKTMRALEDDEDEEQ